MTFIYRKIMIMNQVVDMIFSSSDLIYSEYTDIVRFSPTGEEDDYMMVYKKNSGTVYFLRDEDSEEYLDIDSNMEIRDFLESTPPQGIKADLISNQKFQDFIMMKEMQ